MRVGEAKRKFEKFEDRVLRLLKEFFTYGLAHVLLYICIGRNGIQFSFHSP